MQLKLTRKKTKLKKHDCYLFCIYKYKIYKKYHEKEKTTWEGYVNFDYVNGQVNSTLLLIFDEIIPDKLCEKPTCPMFFLCM